ncbi:MAG: DUF3822 family protein [Bacteroidia bacterium]|nr:DUF3822 family protein [Bacteroidia bacterium]MBT8269329.1 DUF3822 family protein [Bacteroidia bacterium]NNF82831.1 DUF3822 family protein [Flavobacteriaceae bacterium]NNK70632.1 DUF3822 family protein [Flavobacteriaceae bacterium]
METGRKITQLKNNINDLSANKLSIQVSLNGLSFCILDTYNQSITYFSKIDFEKRLNPENLLECLQSEFDEKAELQKSFSSVQIIYNTDLSVFVPQALFDEDHLANYLKFNTRILKNDFITHDPVPANDSVCVYIPFVNVNNYLVERFGTVEYRHYSSLLVEGLLSREKNVDQKRIYVNVQASSLEIVVIDQNSLLLYNTFEYQTREDFIYYILFTAEQLELNPETIPVILMGHIDEDDEYYKMVYRYIRHVDILHPKTAYDIDARYSNEILKEYVVLNSF